MWRFRDIAEPLVSFFRKHGAWLNGFFFLAGVSGDFFRLRRIDNLFFLTQQTALLVILGVFLWRDWDRGPERRRTWFIHFAFGSLLSANTVFYFKSASLWRSAVFVIAMGAILVVNTISRFRRTHRAVRFGLYSLCVSTSIAYFVPIALGAIGAGAFVLSMAVSVSVGLLMGIPFSRGGRFRVWLKEVASPMFSVILLLSISYHSGLIPPIPLSLKHIGIYHYVEKMPGKYLLYRQRSQWRFWELGDQTFRARPDDSIYCFVRVFSPPGFHETVRLRWLYQERGRGWVLQDVIPLLTAGGRDEGFRGFGVKKYYEPGQWQIQVETEEGLEIGRIYFRIERDNGAGGRVFYQREV